jgi:hypothetical protein
MLKKFKHIMRPVVKTLFAISLVLFLGGSRAWAGGNLMDVQILDRDSGQQLTVYQHRGEYYVAGTPGNHYAVSLRNLQGNRMLAVVSVDGVNVISGETASRNQSGYVLAPYGGTEINGWRKNQQQIAAFIFSDEASSYAARTGRPANIGVIGVATFRERQRQYFERRPSRDSESKQSTPQSTPESGLTAGPQHSPALAPKLGTGHGEREDSYAGYTRFTRARNTPDEQISIRYDSYQNLVARGVIPRYLQPQDPAPNPFPGEPGRFVPDPR